MAEGLMDQGEHAHLRAQRRLAGRSGFGVADDHAEVRDEPGDDTGKAAGRPVVSR